MLINYKRVLCPVQFDQNSLAVLAVAGEIATQNKGKVFVMHVVSPHPDPTRVGGAALAAHDEKVAEQEMAALEKDQLANISTKSSGGWAIPPRKSPRLSTNTESIWW